MLFLCNQRRKYSRQREHNNLELSISGAGVSLNNINLYKAVSIPLQDGPARTVVLEKRTLPLFKSVLEQNGLLQNC